MHATPESIPPELRSLLLPLYFFYEKRDDPLPKIDLKNAEELSNVAKDLLVHERDMTSTLTRFHNSALCLEVLAAELNQDYLIRMVILKTVEENLPVEFGAIGINLNMFEEDIIQEIKDGRKPLGGLLEDYKVNYISSPQAYFELTSDSFISNSLHLNHGAQLFGRCNQLTDPEGLSFADIVEVLPQHEE